MYSFQESVAADFPKVVQQLPSVGENLRRHDVQYCSLNNYDLTFAFYSKFPSWGSLQARGPLQARTPLPTFAYQSAIPSPILFFPWWQYKISWISLKALDILRNGHYSWEHLWRLSCFNYRWVFRITYVLSVIFTYEGVAVRSSCQRLWSRLQNSAGNVRNNYLHLNPNWLAAIIIVNYNTVLRKIYI